MENPVHGLGTLDSSDNEEATLPRANSTRAPLGPCHSACKTLSPVHTPGAEWSGCLLLGLCTECLTLLLVGKCPSLISPGCPPGGQMAPAIWSP
jgi:hypothetical protein